MAFSPTLRATRGLELKAGMEATMVRTVLAFIALAGCAGAARGAEHQSPGIGDRVYAKSLAVRPRVGRRTIDELPDGWSWRVTAVRDGWLWVDKGWVRSNDVVRCDEALAWFAAEIATRPSAYAYFSRARALGGANDFRRALDDCNIALRLAPSWSRAYCLRSDLHRALGNGAAALADFNCAIRLDPRDPLARFSRADLLYDEGKFVQALADVNATLHSLNASHHRPTCAIAIAAARWKWPPRPAS